MRGDRVLVRGFKGEGRICRVLDIHNGVAQLTDEEGFKSIQNGEDAAKTVLFRITDVFVYDGTVKDRSFPRWEGCLPYTETVLH